MSKILFIYPNADGYQRIPLGASIVITELLDKGYEVELFDTTFMKSKNTDNELREKIGIVKRTEDVKRDNLSDDEIHRLLENRIDKFNPDLVMASIVEDNYQYATSLFATIKNTFSDLSILVGGTTTTVARDVLIENPFIDYVFSGEFENTFEIKNKNGQLHFNLKDKFTDLNTIPIQRLSLWDQRHFIKPYNGKLYRSGFIEMSRGCMNHCSYCVNASYQNIFKNYGNYFREKSIDNVIKEAKELKEKYNLEMFFFTDDDFLFMGKKRMQEFDEKWTYEIGLPYWVNTRTEMITEFKLDLLSHYCIGIGFGIEHGSEKFREAVLNRKSNNNKIIEKFRMIKDYGIRTTANFMIGFPFETEEHINDTIDLARKIQASSIDITYVAPYYGTELHRLCSELKLIEIDDTPGFRGMAKNISMRKEPSIKNRILDKEKIIYYHDNFYKMVNK